MEADKKALIEWMKDLDEKIWCRHRNTYDYNGGKSSVTVSKIRALTQEEWHYLKEEVCPNFICSYEYTFFSVGLGIYIPNEEHHTWVDGLENNRTVRILYITDSQIPADGNGSKFDATWGALEPLVENALNLERLKFHCMEHKFRKSDYDY